MPPRRPPRSSARTTPTSASRSSSGTPSPGRTTPRTPSGWWSWNPRARLDRGPPPRPGHRRRRQRRLARAALTRPSRGIAWEVGRADFPRVALDAFGSSERPGSSRPLRSPGPARSATECPLPASPPSTRPGSTCRSSPGCLSSPGPSAPLGPGEKNRFCRARPRSSCPTPTPDFPPPTLEVGEEGGGGGHPGGARGPWPGRSPRGWTEAPRSPGPAPVTAMSPTRSVRSTVAPSARSRSTVRGDG